MISVGSSSRWPGRQPAEIVQVVTRLSDGSPFMASAVLRGLIESGALVAEKDGWRIELLAICRFAVFAPCRIVPLRRIDLLPQQAVDLFTVGAILGKEFDLQTAIKLSGQNSFEAIKALDLARQRHLIWVRPDGARCVFVHDKIRTTFSPFIGGDTPIAAPSRGHASPVAVRPQRLPIGLPL